MVTIIPGAVEASPMVPKSILHLSGGKGGSVFDEDFRKQATPIDELNKLCFKHLTSKVPPPVANIAPVAAAAAAGVMKSSGSVAEVSCASSTGSISGNLSDGNGMEHINAKLLKRTISRHGRSSQRWASDPRGSAVRLTTGCVPILENGNVLFVSASSKPLWIFPKGGWEKDEVQEESALREAFEEAGVIGVLGPKLTVVQYETRKSKKRRLESEELLKKNLEKLESSAPGTLKIDNNNTDSASKNAPAKDDSGGCSSEEGVDASAVAHGTSIVGAATASSPAPSNAAVADSADQKEKANVAAEPPVPNAAPVSDEAFAIIREKMLKNPKRNNDETASVQSDASSGYSQVRMCLYPLYITSVKAEWPENGRLRRAAPIDEAIEILQARPELQAALKEVREKGLHLLNGEKIPSTATDLKPTASDTLPKVNDVR